MHAGAILAPLTPRSRMTKYPWRTLLSRFLAGAWRRARKYVLEAFARPTWSPPNAATFNALLRGMIASLDPGALLCLCLDAP